ncbi:MAG: hypothetical protein OEU09_21580 [Rhodospirillales bacterium]|nr:hypothetical protein [Rhodospirillales bacterium]
MTQRNNAESVERAETPAARDLLLKAAREELERAKDHVPLAAERLADLVIKQPGYAALRDEMVEAGCRDLLWRILQQRKRHLLEGRNATQHGERLVNLHRSLLDYPLPGGKRVRHADKKTLTAAAVHYRRRAASQRDLARWLERLAKGLAPGQTVEEVYDEAAARHLQKDAKHA